MDRTSEMDVQTERQIPVGDPETGYNSKMVALRAERHDEIAVTNIVCRYREDEVVPDSAVVVQRTETYYGPKLLLDSGVKNYLLTAPGPDSELLLWAAETTADGFNQGWSKIAEISAEFGDELPQYDLCPYCGEPLKTLEHERMASFGDCSGAD